MIYGLLSGILWAVDTIILTFTPLALPGADLPFFSLLPAGLHDFFCACLLALVLFFTGRLGEVFRACKTRNGKVIMLGALIGGPLGMSGYLLAINMIGPGLTAVISAFYPAVGTVLAVMLLSEKMNLRQILALIIAIAAVMCIGWYTATDSGDYTNAMFGLLGALACVLGWGSEAVILAWGMNDQIDNKIALQIRQTTSASAYILVLFPLAGLAPVVPQACMTSGILCIILAALAGLLSYLCYYKAIYMIGAARAMAANISYSAWSVIFAACITKVMPSWIEIVCCILIAIGTLVASSEFEESEEKVQ